MSNCVHSTDFFFFLPQRAAKSKCQWKMRRTDGKGCVCRQMREWLGGQTRVKNIKIRHFGEVDFQKKKNPGMHQTSGMWQGRHSAKFLSGEFGLEILFTLSLKAVDFDVKGCQIKKKIHTWGGRIFLTFLVLETFSFLKLFIFRWRRGQGMKSSL